MTEEELILNLSRNIPRQKGSLKLGIGDDASVIRMGGKDILITCDSLLEEIHFKRKWASWQTWGAKAAGAALSDIAAMGGKPCFAWVHLSIPKNLKPKQIGQFYQGLLSVFRKFQTTIAGGNISASPKGFGATLTIWGEIKAGKAMLRSAAKVGDKVYISGPVGKTSFKVTPQISLGQWLVRQGCRCSIDVSDGLLQDLRHIAKASKVKIVLNAEKIPHRGNLKTSLTKGEDYVLAFTSKRVLSTQYSVLRTPIKQIGVVQKGKPSVQVLNRKGQPLFFSRLGFEHKV